MEPSADKVVRGTVVDPVSRRIFNGVLTLRCGRIVSVYDCGTSELVPPFILPGFVDAHIHIESSMLTPPEFARTVIRHGTLGVLADPHEIANVLGAGGVRAMMEMADGVQLVIGFAASPNVPATPFETSGGRIDVHDVEALLADPRVTHIGEVMDVGAVLRGDSDITAKLLAAARYCKPVDGHAPLLSGADLAAYAKAGITTDHECVSAEEAFEKINNGIFVQIREGSAARNFDALLPVLEKAPSKCMLCSDDKHPDDLLAGHVNCLVARAVRRGIPLIDVLTAASVNPIRHYHLPLGLLQEGDSADFIVVEDLVNFVPSAVFMRGTDILASSFSVPAVNARAFNKFYADRVGMQDFAWHRASMPAIGVVDGSLLTEHLRETDVSECGKGDLLKLVALSRYNSSVAPAVALVRGMGSVRGAFASSVAHDSHNIIAVGSSDVALIGAVNSVIANRGGIAVTDECGELLAELPLPVAGIMTDTTCGETAAAYVKCDKAAKSIGCTLSAPFMTLSFLALPVIPHLKITDKGLFDVDAGKFI